VCGLRGGALAGGSAAPGLARARKQEMWLTGWMSAFLAVGRCGGDPVGRRGVRTRGGALAGGSAAPGLARARKQEMWLTGLK